MLTMKAGELKKARDKRRRRLERHGGSGGGSNSRPASRSLTTVPRILSALRTTTRPLYFTIVSVRVWFSSLGDNLTNRGGEHLTFAFRDAASPAGMSVFLVSTIAPDGGQRVELADPVKFPGPAALADTIERMAADRTLGIVDWWVSPCFFAVLAGDQGGASVQAGGAA